MPKLSRLAIFKKKIKPFIIGQDPEPYMPPNAARVATLLKNSFLLNFQQWLPLFVSLQ